MEKLNYNAFSDEELVELVAGKDDDAFAVLTARYDRFLKFKIRPYYIKGADRDDLIQEARIGLYIAALSFNREKGCSFSTFAVLCVSSAIKRAIRRSNSKRNTPLNDYISIDNKDDSPKAPYPQQQEKLVSEDPSEYLIALENTNKIHRFIENTLSESERVAVKRMIDGKSYIQIADEMGANVKSVDNALQRARKKISVYLISEEYKKKK